MLSRTTCNSSWIFIPLTELTSVKTGRFLFGLILQVLAHRKSISFLFIIQQTCTNFAAICLMFQPSIVMYRHLTYDMPRMLQTLPTVHVCRRGWVDACSPHFHQSNLMVCNLKVQKLQPKFGPFWNVNIIQRHTLEPLHCHERWLDGNSLLLKKCHFTGLQHSQITLNTNTFKW